MSLDPRDRAVESMLRSSGPTPPPSAECLDAETLAMWADGGLDASSLARAEAHMADCGRCQAMMAALAQATDATPAVAEAEAAPTRGWWPLNIRWLVPLAGAVTAVLVWMIVPSGQPRSTPPPVAVSGKAESSPPAAEADAVGSESRQPATGAALPQPAGASATEPARRSEVRPSLREQRADSKTQAETERMARAEAPAVAAAEKAAPAAPMAAGATSEEAVNRAAFAQAGPVIVSRDAGVQWRIRADGVVERSTNAGQSWIETDGAVAATVLAGASPAPDVCWLVGRGGLVLVTTDARTWQRVTAPATGDLVSVEALDARQATVRSAAGVSYRTDDGGVTWRRAP